MMKIGNKLSWVCIPMLIFGSLSVSAQCSLYDFDGNPSNTPVWYSCNGGNFTLNLQSPFNIGPWSVDWGDGSPLQTGSGLTPPASIAHIYSATVGMYNVTFIATSTGCTVNGLVVMEEATSASIQIPVGGLTQACAPKTLQFINSSTNTSTNTVFTWNFGDGSPIETYDYTNLGQTISHTYMPGTVDCETVVTLTAENSCNIVQGGPSQATFNPIRIWDIDDAAIGASATVLCWPDNTVTFSNNTERNCLFQGNIFQRYEYWNLGDYWGLGYDSIIDWKPWPPSFPQTIQFPGIGSYTVHMLDSNICGIAPAAITIQIVAPPVANASASATTICVGQTVTFSNLSSGNANQFIWNFGDGGPFLITNSPTVMRAYNTPGIYNVTLTASVTGTSSACSSTFTIPITVLPAPDAGIGYDVDSACDFLEVNFADASTGDVVSWAWDFGNGNTSTSQNPPPQQYNAVGPYNVTLTVTSSNGCVNSTSHIVRVFETPVADFDAPGICEDSQTQFLDLSSHSPGDPFVAWDWNFGEGNTSNVENPINVFSAAGTYLVTLEVSTANCSAQTQQNVTVHPNPTSLFAADVTLGCGPLDVVFTNQSTGSSSYIWLFGDGNGDATVDAQHTFVNYGNVDSVYTVRLIARSAFGCTDTSTVDITVHPHATALFQTAYTPGCNPLPANFVNNSLNATSYTWDFGDGSPISTDVNPTHQFVNTGLGLANYTVTLTALTPNGCNDQMSGNISVYPEPNFDFTLPQDTGCAPFTVQFPIINGAIAQFWTFGDGNISAQTAPLHTYGNNTTVPLTYHVDLVATSAFGCTATSSATVVVNPNPIVQFSVNLTSGCSPLTVSFDNQSLLADSVIWSYGDGELSDTLAQFHSHVFENNTNQTVTYTVELVAYTENGCIGTFSRNIEVYPSVNAAFTSPPEGCSPMSFVFQNNSQNASLYQWNLGNGTVSLAENPIGGYQNFTNETDTFLIELTATSIYGCSDQTQNILVLHPKPNASIVPNTVAGCSPLDVTFVNNSSMGDTFIWNYGNGNTAVNPDTTHVHTFVSTMNVPQTYLVSMVAATTEGCADTVFQNITVYPEVIAGFVPEATGCTPLAVNFVNQSFGALSYFYAFGDGNQAFVPNPSNTFLNLTDSILNYNVQMVAQSGFGCTDTAYQVVTVYPLPDVQFSVGSIEGCFPADVTFVNNSNGVDVYEWNYGDGATSDVADSAHVHTYVNGTTSVQTYIVTLTGTTAFGCEETQILSLDIIPEIVASVTPPIGGCSPYQANFINTSTGAFTYLWEFGDGTVSQELNPTYTYTNPTVENEVYTVSFTAQSLWGCAETIQFDIAVQGLPEANFIAAPAVQQFPNATLTLANLSNANSEASYTWFWGDGTSTVSMDPSDPAEHTYGTWGIFEIRLRVGTELCWDETVQTVRIDPPLPIASFDGQGEGCVPVPVSFTNTSQYGVSYTWNFGDGGVSTIENPTYVYYQPGTYYVTLTVIGPGGESDSFTSPDPILVHPRAEAFFTVNPPVVSIPAQVFFLNLSTNASLYTWDFGDGSTSNSFSPEHFYETLGWHAVTLVANNIYNCPDTFTVDQAVLGNVDSQLAFPNAFTPNTNGPSGGFWTIDDMFNNDIFFPQYKGVKEFEMQIFNKWGELLFETKDVKQGWDGYYRGRICQQDVYVWKARVTFLDGGQVTDMGDVTLIR